MSRAIILLAEGFEPIEALTVVDVLRRGGVEVTTAAVGNSIEVAGAHGVTVKADTLMSKLPGELAEAIVLPGGPGTGNLNTSEVHALLRRYKEEDRLICAICAAPTVLVKAEVLDEETHVTCYPSCVMELDRPSAAVPVVVDDNIITGQAPGSAMLFALVVLKTLEGEKTAIKVAHGMVTDVLEG